MPAELAGAVRPGSLVRVPFGARRVRGIVLAVEEAPPGDDLAAVAAVIFPSPVAPPPLGDLLDWIARRYAAPRGRAFGLCVPPRVRVRTAPPEPLRGGPSPRLILGYSGGRALIDAIARGAPGTWCVQARPGENRGGLIAELVAAAGGSTALVAVPEVRYGSLVLDELARFWPGLERVDSSRSEGDRSAAWARLAAGHGIGGGGRTAVLAPTPTLRLIVLDEEHHPTYKETRAPSYDARRAAAERARLQGGLSVFVSATPSVELGAAALEGGAGSVTPRREDLRASRPLVELADRPSDRAIGHALHERLRDALRAGRRVALLAPRRGYSRALWCGACRRSLRCPRCEAGLFFDRSAARVRCARCGDGAPAPDDCPACGAREWLYLGAGSERLEEQLRASFPRASVRRMDPEVLERGGPQARGRGGGDGATGGDADIYVTTWIGTKAALRPPASLVAVLDADALIRRADFRSAERAHQALAELSEWAGPASGGGHLFVQTAEPGHHAVQAIARSDYGFFLRRELAARRELSYPPYSELVKVTASGPDRRALIDAAATALRRLPAWVLGPIAAGDTLQVLGKCRDGTAAGEALRGVAAGSPRGSSLRVDVDPR